MSHKKRLFLNSKPHNKIASDCSDYKHSCGLIKRLVAGTKIVTPVFIKQMAFNVIFQTHQSSRAITIQVGSIVHSKMHRPSLVASQYITDRFNEGEKCASCILFKRRTVTLTTQYQSTMQLLEFII